MKKVLLVGLLLAGCATKPLPLPPQSVAQQISAHWPAVTSGIALALIASNANPLVVAAVTQQEGVLGPQIAACAAGTDVNCTAQLQGAIATFLQGLVPKLGTKGGLELQAVQGLLVGLVPGLPTSQG